MPASQTATITALLVALLIASPAHKAQAATTISPDGQPERELELSEAPEGLQSLITAIIVDNLPDSYEDDDDWGGTKEVFRGIKLRREGLKLETKRRKKRVNHGTWKLYRIRQIDPQEHVKVRIEDVRTHGDGSVSFQIEFVSRINAYARLSEWNRGLRLMSTSIDADADVALRLDCSLATELVPAKFPPDLILRPEVTNAELKVRRFRVNRISHFDGPIARELGESLQRVLLKKVNEKRPKLVAKINRQIAKNEDKLRLSITDTVREKWKSISASHPDDDANHPDDDAKADEQELAEETNATG